MAEQPQAQNNEQSHKINLHVPGILNLLSEHLYSDPRVALREMIQNAHDSCQRRMTEDSIVKGYQPRIDILLDSENRIITIKDNGSGLTEDEIHQYLATVGRGYTAELRERLQFGSRDEALALIGQFGLGLLSAFIVANKLELTTLSYRPDNSAWRWVSAGEETYTLAPSEKEMAGSTFKLYLKTAGEFLLNEGLVEESIRTYADFLEVPIYLNNSTKPVNVIDAPWHIDAGETGYKIYIADRFATPEPLTILPLEDHVEVVTLPDGSTDEIITPLAGVLFVPIGSVVSIREYGDIAVYIRRMFITNEERDLLPRWAKFVRGVIDSPVLKPTVSREQVRRDETFYRIQRAIEGQLIDHFQDLAENDPGVWRSIVLGHNDLIKGWALQSPIFFESVCDLVTFETSRGRLTMSEYLEASGGDIYYFVEERGALQEKMLYEAQGLVVIDASRFAEEPFLKAYVRLRDTVELRQLEPGSSFVFAEEDEADWLMISQYYRQQGIKTKVVRFEPVSIPAILIYPPGSDHIADARTALNNGSITGPMANLVNAYLDMRDPTKKGTEGTLHLNTANPLMQLLIKLKPGHLSFTATLEIIYHNARFFAGRTLTVQEARIGFDMISYSVEELVKAAGGNSSEAS